MDDEEAAAAAKAVVESVREGLPIVTAVKVAGISRSTHYLWLKQDEQYRRDVEQADGQRQQKHLKKIREKGSRDWKSDAWVLERTSSDFREKKDLSVHVEQALEALLDAVRPEMSEEAYAELIEAVIRVQGLATGEDGQTLHNIPRGLPSPGHSGSFGL